jgi:MFS transporter, DHA1 family, multidrug resistance protein
MKPDTTPTLSKFQQHEFTVLMALLMSIVAISIDALLPALGLISEELQLLNRNHAQYVITLLFIGMALGELICGPLSDALGRKPVLYGGVLLYLAGSVVCYLAPDLTQLLLGRFIQGLGVAGPYISVVSVVRDKYSGRQMASVMSIIMMIFILVPAIAPALGQLILFLGDWRAIFLFYMVYALVITLWIFLRLEETLKPENRIPFSLPNIRHGMIEILSHQGTRNYMICMGICFGSFLGYLNSSQQIFQEQFKTGDLFALYFGVLALILGAASLLNARFVEQLGMHYICVRAFAVIIIASVLFLILNLLVNVTLAMFLIYAAVLFFCFGLIFGNLNALAMEPMGHIAGIATAVIGAVSSLMSLIIGTVIGQLYDNTLIPITTGFAIFGALALWHLMLARRAKSVTQTP